MTKVTLVDKEKRNYLYESSTLNFINPINTEREQDSTCFSLKKDVRK